MFDFLIDNATLTVPLVVAILLLWRHMNRTKPGVINHQQLSMLVNHQDALLYDIRAKEVYDKGHIAGAKNIDVDKLKRVAHKTKDASLILVCERGERSSQQVADIRASTTNNNIAIYCLDKGMTGWELEALPQVTS